MVGIIGKFRELRQSQHAAEQVDALGIESEARQGLVFGDDPRGEVAYTPLSRLVV
jgi:hypothetical protein